VIFTYPVDIKKGDSINILREKAILSGLKGFISVFQEEEIRGISVKEKINQRQCFRLSRTMKCLLNEKLNYK
jgi:hypothetical protein